MRPHHYFAYGSNMNPQRVLARGLGFRAIIGGRVADLDLCFDKQSADHAGSGHANLVYRRDHWAEGLLYELVSDDEIMRMDPFESAPINYSRELVQVITASGPVSAWTYFANDAVRVADARPEPTYLGHLLQGRPWLSPAWYRRLAAWPTAAA